ncbi:MULTISPECIES: MmgE/PrpD family protein [Acinetobacter calcoaceticus/baumannii complex]|uniref:MmgE/PrpD family protein n=1 Tax=Acinetobacter calcoaceticus/baumannii complex TaxID=909768 RepID=UPI00244AA8D4|nr:MULTISPECIES: MmgE/PrpD family protein [Acinetobacter calcoaceticus/baumannii complex]MDH2595931.1 MmgE/PrpD family protein [Acinetobacter baumannii]MDO7536694.1 MmgE/PrpD family protein [Acinetobacter pittii]
MNLTKTVSKFSSNLKLENIPDDILQKVKWHFIDALACGWAASNTSICRDVRTTAFTFAGNGKCSVFGSTEKGSPIAAAFINAFTINALDHDDGLEINGKGMGHPSATLVSALLAALDFSDQSFSSNEILVALTAGYEINNRLISSIQPSAERFKEVYGVAQHQAIGASVVFGRLLNFSEDQMHNAIGHAASLTCLPSLHKYNWNERPILTIKDAVAPAAQAGVQAALMSIHGLSGCKNVLDGEQGYWRMIGSDQFNHKELVSELGSNWFIKFGSFKKYPACRWIACALECMEQIIDETGWCSTEIVSIKVFTFKRVIHDFMYFPALTDIDAQFSLPHSIAAISLKLPNGSAWFDENITKSKEFIEIARKVEAIVDDEYEQKMSGYMRQPGARLVVEHVSGQKFCKSQTFPLGGGDRPLSDLELIKKVTVNLTDEVVNKNQLISELLNGQNPTIQKSKELISLA